MIPLALEILYYIPRSVGITRPRHDMKISRRTVIKSIGASAASLTAASAVSAKTKNTEKADTISVQIAHQWAEDSIAAVIKNTSAHHTAITNINSVTADYGRFNFEALTSNGPLHLAPGQEVHVPFTVMGTPVKPYGHFDNRLQKKLKESLVVSTANTLSKVSTSISPRLV